MMKRMVVKFGGTSIGTPERVKLAVGSVEKEVKAGEKVLVVVSAMGSTTDDLVDTIKEVTGLDNISPMYYAEILSMGERTSARLFSASLNSIGVKSVFIDPSMSNWPLITDSNYLKANILREETKRVARESILRLWDENIVPVVGGFIGKDLDGNVTLLGRGGSDVTAFVLAEALEADEVIIVTDVDGVLTADPRKISSTVEIVDNITAEEMHILAENGAKVLHPDAVKFKPPGIRAKIIHYKYGDLSVRGTEIKGSLKEQVMLLSEKLSMLTVVGEKFLETSGILKKIIEPLSDKGISIYSFALGDKYISIYVRSKDEKEAYKLVHDVVVSENRLKSVTVNSDIAMVMVASRLFIETPGIIQRLTLPLSKHNINIIEMVTIKTDIFIFVNWKDKDLVYAMLLKEMEDIKKDVLGTG